MRDCKATIAFFAFLPALAAIGDIDPSKLDAVLSKHVADGRVDYAELKKNPAPLDAYLKEVAEASGELQLAFCLNAYNALVLKGLSSQPKLPSRVTDLKGFFDANRHTVAGRAMTLNDLSKKIRGFKDPRVHFAMCDGSAGSPPLSPKAFTDKDLDETLSRLAREFVDSDRGVRINDTKKEIQCAKVFDWFAGDFFPEAKDDAGKKAALLDYLLKRIADPARARSLEAAKAGGYKLTFQHFSWAPNSRDAGGAGK